MIRHLGTFQVEDGLAFASESTCPLGQEVLLTRYLGANAEEKIKFRRNETRKPFPLVGNK